MMMKRSRIGVLLSVLVLMMTVLCFTPLQAQAALDLSSYEAFKAQASGSYLECKKGDSGGNVLRIKERLQDLGYYRATATFDDDFNDTMVQRIKLFQENNSLEMTGKVDSSTAAKLKESNPIRGEYYEGYWTEPDVTLIIPDSSYGKWDEKSGDRFTFKIEAKNVSTSRRIIAAEFLVYTEDIWGDELIRKNRPYSYSLEDTFKPGEMKYTTGMIIPYRQETHKVYIAVNKVRYSDGTIGRVTSPLYWGWTIDW